MSELLTAAQMKAIETDQIESGAVTGAELMERAGKGVANAILDQWPDLAVTDSTTMPRVAVLCGPGNNGGDGFVVARHLAARGWQVQVSLLGEAEALPEDARANHDRWREIGPVEPLGERSLGTYQAPPDVVIDALFGTGLTRGIEGEAAFLLENLATLHEAAGTRRVAVDIPSGLCADSGVDLGGAPVVDLTVSFHREKLGHRLAQGSLHCGHTVLVNIGLLDPDPEDEVPVAHVSLVTTPPAGALSKPASGQKYTHGHALVVSGAPGRTGAARMAGRAALRVGAGLVTLVGSSGAQAELGSQLTAIMIAHVKSAEDLTEMLWDTRINALCLGPAMGLSRGPRSVVEAVLPLERATVLDADALTLFRDAPADLFELTHEKCILTPHGGEFARLFPDIAKKLNAPPTRGPAYSKVDATRAAARRAGCVVLFKGADTVIAAPDGACAVHSAHYDRAAPWLATAGAGDVLSGLITGLLARGLGSMEAAKYAAWLHVETALRFGPGLIAEDLPEQLPAVFRDLGV